MPSIKERRDKMRLDLDCMRAIVVAIADNLTPDSFGRIDPIPAQDLPSLIPNFPANDIYYWTNQLIESGIIIPGKRYIRDPLPSIKNLSLLGYQFIETACSVCFRHSYHLAPKSYRDCRVYLIQRPCAGSVHQCLLFRCSVYRMI